MASDGAPVAAYRWWNTTIDPFGNVDLPPACASPAQASEVWKILCLVVSPADPIDKY